LFDESDVEPDEKNTRDDGRRVLLKGGK